MSECFVRWSAVTAVLALLPWAGAVEAYTAIASYKHNRRAVTTVAHGQPSQQEANAAALESCRTAATGRFPVPECIVIGWQAQPGYGAVACAKFGECEVGFGRSERAALDDAVKNCRSGTQANHAPESCAPLEGYVWQDTGIPAGTGGGALPPKLRVDYGLNDFGKISIRITSEDDRPIRLTRFVINKRVNVPLCDLGVTELKRVAGEAPLAYGDYVDFSSSAQACGRPIQFTVSTDKGDTVFTDR